MVRGNEIAAVTAVKNGSVVYRNIWLSEVKDGVFKAYMGAASREFKAEGKLAEEAKDRRPSGSQSGRSLCGAWPSQPGNGEKGTDSRKNPFGYRRYGRD